MPRRPDQPCSRCGKLIWRGRASLPAGEATCRPCRAAQRQGACQSCGATFQRRGVDQRFCSGSCGASTRARGPRTFVLGIRTCGECSSTFGYKQPNQTYCTRSCLNRARNRNRSNYRRRARAAGVGHEPIDKRRVFARDGWRCGLCRRKVDKRLKWPHPKCATLDHIVPMSRGGDHHYANVQCAHRICNEAKGAGAVGEQLALVG